ncbi:MAG TPA: OsmC family protein [Candidatus Dormibacteraeota bacterium]
MARITVTHRHGESFDIRVRGYALISDEPITLGGDDEGPTPTELMVAGLAACAADEVVRCLAAIGEKFEPTEIGGDFAWDAEGGRVASIRLSVTLPCELSASTREKVLKAMLSCPARKMLAEPPSVDYKFESVEVPASVAPAVDGGGWPEEPPPDVDSEG